MGARRFFANISFSTMSLAKRPHPPVNLLSITIAILGFGCLSRATIVAPNALNLRITQNVTVEISPTLYGYMWEVGQDQRSLIQCSEL